jgi:hypothetical protein
VNMYNETYGESSILMKCHTVVIPVTEGDVPCRSLDSYPQETCLFFDRLFTHVKRLVAMNDGVSSSPGQRLRLDPAHLLLVANLRRFCLGFCHWFPSQMHAYIRYMLRKNGPVPGHSLRTTSVSPAGLSWVLNYGPSSIFY